MHKNDCQLLLTNYSAVYTPAALLCPHFTRGKNPCFFPLAAPLFPSATVGPRSHLKMGPAAGRRTNARPKRLNGLFYLPWFILICSTGQIRRMGGRKTRQKRGFNGINLPTVNLRLVIPRFLRSSVWGAVGHGLVSVLCTVCSLSESAQIVAQRFFQTP